MTLQKKQIKFFKDIGYYHPDWAHCSQEGELASVCDCSRLKKEWKSGHELVDWHNYQDHYKTFDE